MKNKNNNKTLIDTILIKDAFPLDRRKTKKQAHLIPKTNSKGKIKTKKSQHNFTFPPQAWQSAMRVQFNFNII